MSIEDLSNDDLDYIEECYNNSIYSNQKIGYNKLSSEGFIYSKNILNKHRWEVLYFPFSFMGIHIIIDNYE